MPIHLIMKINFNYCAGMTIVAIRKISGRQALRQNFCRSWH